MGGSNVTPSAGIGELILTPHRQMGLPPKWEGLYAPTVSPSKHSLSGRKAGIASPRPELYVMLLAIVAQCQPVPGERLSVHRQCRQLSGILRQPHDLDMVNGLAVAVVQ